MTISYCKKCKTTAAGHHVEPLSYYGSTMNLWRCNYCQYRSLRFHGSANAEQFWPVEPRGIELNDSVPELIRKDFDEARLVVNYSVRAGNTLLRICLERICNWVAKEFLTEDEQYNSLKTLHKRVEYLSKHCTDIFTTNVSKMAVCIQWYGNDNAHAHRKIEDSDTEESFDIMKKFIEAICNKVCEELTLKSEIDKMRNKIPDKAQTK